MSDETINITSTFKGGPLDGDSVVIRTGTDIEGATMSLAVRNPQSSDTIWHRYELRPVAMGASEWRYAGDEANRPS